MYGDEYKTKYPQFIIRMKSENKRIITEIENNGQIILPEQRKHIFEPFFTTKGIGKGTGLGLSVSYFIITKNHNGRMWLDTNNGTKFIIELPLQKFSGDTP
jgi:signal transduction histidine kinase